MNGRPVCDTLWMASASVGMGPVLPQRWLVASLAVVTLLLHQVAVVHCSACQAGADSPLVGHLLLGAFALAALPRTDLNGRPVFDTFWIAGRSDGVASVLAYRWLASLLAMVLWFLHRQVVVHRGAYQAGAVSLPFGLLPPIACTLMALPHVDMSSRPVFDTL